MGVCKECQNGVHKHLEAMKEPWFKDLSFAEKVDGMDCKVVIGPYDQCVCPKWKEEVERLRKERDGESLQSG